MRQSRFTAEQMVAIIREADRDQVPVVAKRHGVSEQTIYTWRKRFDGFAASDVRRLRQLEAENGRLKKLVAERDLEIEVNWVWGIEGDIDYVNAKGTADAAICSGCTFKDTWLATLRGRLGYSVDRWLPYITGGGASGNAYVSSPGGAVSDTKGGWSAGAGIEWAFLPNWSAKVEYLYVDLGDATCDSASCLLPADATIHFTFVVG